MNTLYSQSLRERIARLTKEFVGQEQQLSEVIGSRPSKCNPGENRKHLQAVVATMEALRQVKQRLHRARRLLARAQGDDYVFTNNKGSSALAQEHHP